MEKPSDFAVLPWITTVWNRITVSRLTIIYFCFSILHFVAQIALQSRALTINETALNSLNGFVTNKTELDTGLPIMQGSTLRVCTWIPDTMQTDSSGCTVIWDFATSNSSSQLLGNFTSVSQSASTQPTTTHSGFTSTSQPTSSTVPSTTRTSTNSDAQPTVIVSTTQHVSTTASATTSLKLGVVRSTTTFPAQSTTSSASLPSSTGNVNSSVLRGTNATDSAKNASSAVRPIESRQIATHLVQELKARSNIDSLCQASLVWPISELRDSQREDIVFIAFQCWVLGVSIVALLNESIPHICASMVTHFMATCWAAFRIYDTAVFKSDFNRVILNGACNGVTMLPAYWNTRFLAEVAGLIVNVVAMFISGYLTWKIFQLFGWQTFKRVGASLVINRIYRLVLVLSTVIQVSFFFMATTVALWIDRLVNSPIGDLASFRELYLATSAITLILLIPWLAMGWFGIRRELRLPMFFFLFLSLLYLGGWGVMFFSTTFLWTFITWTFFAIMACASVLLTCISFILGVICRYNFGKGLHRHLNNSTSESMDTPNYDIEKPKLPSGEMFNPSFTHQPEMNLPPAQIAESSAVVDPTWPQRSNSSASSSSESRSRRNSFDAPSNLEAGVSRSSTLNSTASRTKRWVIE